MVRGMSVEEAIRQLSFHKLPTASIMRDVRERSARRLRRFIIHSQVLIEAQEMAVKEHNIEYKSNLWVCKYRAEERRAGIVWRVCLSL